MLGSDRMGSDRIGVSVCPHTRIWPPLSLCRTLTLDCERIFSWTVLIKCNKYQQSLDLARCLLAAGHSGPVCNSTRIVPLIGSPIIWLPFLLPLFLVPALPSECLVFSIALTAPYCYPVQNLCLFPPHSPAANNEEGAQCSLATASPFCGDLYNPPPTLFWG